MGPCRTEGLAAAENREKKEEQKHMNHDEPEHQRIAQLAYDLWQKRGCPIGSPDEDWFRVENETSAGELRRATGECLPHGPDRTVTSTDAARLEVGLPYLASRTC
jgi:hypothetical protein